MFVNSNYSAKLSPTMKENWLVQIFKHKASSVLTGATSNATLTHDDYFLRFSLAADSGSTTATFNSQDYLPAILNKPSVSTSLDLKSFTTRTGSVTLNIANVNIDGTDLLELLGNEYINGQVNILSVIDDDSDKANALQIFSGKVSSFAYKNNVIIVNIITNRPFQDVEIPNAQTTGAIKKFKPVVYGKYEANGSSSFAQSTNVFPCPFLRNDGNKMYYLLPEQTTTGTDKLEFYDTQMQRFMHLVNSDDTAHGSATQLEGARVLGVPKEMVRTSNVLPLDIGPSNTASLVGAGVSMASGAVADTYDGSSSTSATFQNTAGWSAESKGVVLKLIFPQVTGKITAITLGLTGTYSQTITGSPSGQDGAFFNISKTLSSNFGSSSGDVELVGTSSSGIKTNQTNTALPTSTNIASLLVDDALPDDLYLSFRFNAEAENGDYSNFNVILKNIYITITAENDLGEEPIATQSFNAGVDVLYLGRGSFAKTYQSGGQDDSSDIVDNPVAIHRELLKNYLGIDFASSTQVSNSGYNTVVNDRDESGTEWKARLMLTEPTSIESVLQQMQFEGGFFFEMSPQAQQTTDVAGTFPYRYFHIADSPSVVANLSEVDIDGYEIGITDVQDLETSIVVNYDVHIGEDKFLKNATFESTTAGSRHDEIFDNAKEQVKQFNLGALYQSVDAVGSNRNDDWVNYRTKLFGEYKTTMGATIVNPEKYGMLQIGDVLDFGDTLFGNLGTPFDEISDTFDSMVAMPTRLFKDQWTNKKFIITNLRREIGKVSIQCREVS